VILNDWLLYINGSIETTKFHADLEEFLGISITVITLRCESCSDVKQHCEEVSETYPSPELSVNSQGVRINENCH
jgi:hypothetical protein